MKRKNMSRNGNFVKMSVAFIMLFVASVTMTYGQSLQLTDIVKSKVSGKMLKHTGYVTNFNTMTNTPNWVAWELTSSELNGNFKRKGYDFMPDPLIQESKQVTKYDYNGSGYDRGHMCPAGDMTWSASAMNDCFYMTNICPQVKVVNQTYWEHLESACRRWAGLYGSIYIVCGPIYNGKYKYIGNYQKVAVPDAFFKVVICLNKGHEMGIGFYYTNTEERQTMESAACTIDQIEQLTGYDFFPALDDKVEKAIESMNKLSKWN